jgi:hypothetical protein
VGFWGVWDRLRGKGGNPEEEADLREELGGEDPGEAEERYLSGAGYGAGLNVGDAADVAEADLEETKPPPDPAP